MGTNYYICCKHCHCELLHLGKQSAGHGFNSNFTKEELQQKLQNLRIVECIKDEYARVVSVEGFWEKIVIEGWIVLEAKGFR